MGLKPKPPVGGWCKMATCILPGGRSNRVHSEEGKLHKTRKGKDMKKYGIYEMRNQVNKEQLEKSCCNGGNSEFIKDFKTLAEALKEVEKESWVIAQSGTHGTYYDVTEYIVTEEDWENEDGEEVFVQGTEVFRSEMPAYYKITE